MMFMSTTKKVLHDAHFKHLHSLHCIAILLVLFEFLAPCFCFSFTTGPVASLSNPRSNGGTVLTGTGLTGTGLTGTGLTGTGLTSSLPSSSSSPTSMKQKRKTNMKTQPKRHQRYLQHLRHLRHQPRTTTRRRRGKDNDHHHHHHQIQIAIQYNYLLQATDNILKAPLGSFTKGKHHELYSILHGWYNLIHCTDLNVLTSITSQIDISAGAGAGAGAHKQSNQPIHSLLFAIMKDTKDQNKVFVPVLIMEALLRRIVQEFVVGKNQAIVLSTQWYNLIISSWCTIASSMDINNIHMDMDNDSQHYEQQHKQQQYNQQQHKQQHSSSQPPEKSTEVPVSNNENYETDNIAIHLQQIALQRAFEILQQLQNTFEEHQQNINTNNNTNEESIQPDVSSFEAILDAHAKVAIQLSKRKEQYWNRHRHRHHNDNDQKRVMQKAHYILLYQEYLYRTNRNLMCKPRLISYTTVMDMYSKCQITGTGVGNNDTNAGGSSTNATSSTELTDDLVANEAKRNCGYRVEQVLRLLEFQKHTQPNTFCYNMLLDAYLKPSQTTTTTASMKTDFIHKARKNMKQNRRFQNNKHSERKQRIISYYTHDAEKLRAIGDAQRIYKEMQYRQNDNIHSEESSLSYFLQPDVSTYTSLITSWTSLHNNGSGAFNAQRLLFQMEDNYYARVNIDSQEERRESFDHTHVIAPRTNLYNIVLKAWCRSNHPNSPANALHIMERMKKMYELQSKNIKEKNGTTINKVNLHTFVSATPDRVTFNTILHILSKHGSRESLLQAEVILSEMEEYERNGIKRWAPNLFSYNTVIECYSQHSYYGDNIYALKAFNLLKKVLINRKLNQQSKTNENGSTDAVSPDLFSFNRVIFALSKSGTKQSTLLIEELLRFMENECSRNASAQMRPDVYSYSSAISAWARSHDRNAGNRAEVLLGKMEDRYNKGEKALKPNVVTFNSVIDCHAKSGQGTAGARKAERILERMEMMYIDGDKSVKPNVNTYNGVISAWARSNTKCAHLKSLAVLQQMWKLYKDGNDGVKPDAHAYNTVISAVSRSQRDDKAQKALRLLREMDILYRRDDKEHKNVRPNERTYTSVLNSCAYSIAEDTKVRRKALDTAIFTMEELMDSPYGRPNHVAYGMFLACCANLIPSDDKRLRITIIEPVFLKCCRDGQVNELVLNQFRLAAPKSLYNKLLGEVAQKNKVRINDIPPEWKCNVRGERWKGRKCRANGRKKKY